MSHTISSSYVFIRRIFYAVYHSITMRVHNLSDLDHIPKYAMEYHATASIVARRNVRNVNDLADGSRVGVWRGYGGSRAANELHLKSI